MNPWVLWAANNMLLPVILDITSHEDQDGPKNVVKVSNRKDLGKGRHVIFSCALGGIEPVRSCADRISAHDAASTTLARL